MKPSRFAGCAAAAHRATADHVTIRWPSGEVSELRDVAAGRLLLCEPPE